MKLSQILGLESGVKSRNYGEVSDLNKSLQKPDLFSGFSKNYRPKDDDGETYPPENKIVQMIATEVLDRAAKLWSETFDLIATKDYANMQATADVIVYGDVYIIKGAPVPFLIFMEKQLNDIRTFVEHIPTLDAGDKWNEDKENGIWKTEPVATHRTKKVQKPIVLYDAVDKHPAQTQLITEDVTVGHWDTVKMSGAMPAARKKQILEKINILSDAFKVAREKANMADAPAQNFAKGLFAFLLS